MDSLADITQSGEDRERVAVTWPGGIEDIHVARSDLHLCRRPVTSLDFQRLRHCRRHC